MSQSGSSGKGYDVTSSGSNSQVLMTLSVILTQDTNTKIRAITTVAETTLPQPEAAKPIATLIITPTLMVSLCPPGHSTENLYRLL